MRRRWLVWAWAAGLALSAGCEEELDDEQIVAARADQTLRQLIAGLNAQKTAVLDKLLVVTSTTGGGPRALSADELKAVVFPEPPFAYAGPGAPGYMRLKDGEGKVHRVHLVVVDDALKVVARRTTMPAGGLSAQVTTFMEPVASK